MAVEQEKVLQELPCPGERKKVDGLTLFGTRAAKDIMVSNTGKRDLKYLESKPMYDLRKSLAWDSAFSSSPGFLEPEELLNTLHSGISQNGCDILGDEEHHLLSAKYLEPDIESVIDESNLRKSLAWDSAFFTSEGVLNPEELSLVNKGFKKSEIQILPRIEELRASCESNSSIDNDGTSLASLEVELFEDARASMQQVTVASRRAAASSTKERYRNIQRVNSTKNVDGDVVPKLKVKFRPTSIRQSINGIIPERIAKESSTLPLRKLSAGSVLSNPLSPLKPLKKRGRNIPMAPANRVHLASNEVSGEGKILRATDGKTSGGNPGSCTDTDASAQSGLEAQPHGQSSEVKGSMCSTNTCTEEKGSNSASSDASRIIKPSGLRMPSPKIGFFDVDDSLVPSENEVRKLQSGVQNAVSNVGVGSRNLNGNATRSRRGKIQTSQILKDLRTTKTFPQQTRGSLVSGTMKSVLGLSQGSKAQSELHWEEKSQDCLRNYYEKKVNVSATEREFEVESCARMVGRGAQESMGNDPHMLHDSEKENLIGFRNKLEGLHEQLRTLDVSGDVVIEF